MRKTLLMYPSKKAPCKALCVCVVMLGISTLARAQYPINIDSLAALGICTDEGYALPSVQGMPRSKGVQIFQERTPNYNLTSNYVEGDSSFTNEIRRDKMFMFRLRIPVIRKDNFTFITGLRFLDQQFAFQDPAILDNGFQQGLQDKIIRSVGVSLISLNSFKGRNYLLSRGTLRLNGDFRNSTEPWYDYQKTSLSVIYGTKAHCFKSWGIGVSYSNTFGNSTIYPVFVYQEKFNEKWGINAFLPVFIRLIYMANDKNILYFENKVQGDNYNLDFDNIEGSPFFWEKSDFQTLITYEREIYDWLWAGFSFGARINLNFNMTYRERILNFQVPIISENDLVVESNLGNALFFKYGIFIVPPRKWMEPK